MNRRRQEPIVDESWLVWVAARATGHAPEALLAGTDVAAMARVVAEADDAQANDVDVVRSRAVAVAAAVLVAIVRHRPFATGNRAVAWLAAAVTLAEYGAPVWLSEDEAVALVVGAEDGRVSVHDVAAALAAPGEVLPWPCPACGRRLHRYERRDVRRAVPMVGGSRHELVARCAFEHGRHDRTGRTAHRSLAGMTDPWRPIVRQPSGQGGMLVLVDDGAVLMRRVGGAYEMTRHRELATGALLGDWDELSEHGEPLGRVDRRDVVADGVGGAVDWTRLTRALRGAPVA